MQEYTVVMILSVIVKGDDEKDVVRKAAIPFQHGLVPNMGKFVVNAVRPTIDGDRNPIDFELLK